MCGSGSLLAPTRVFAVGTSVLSSPPRSPRILVMKIWILFAVALQIPVFAHGEVVLSHELSDGRKYSGPLIDGKMHGKGGLVFPNGNRYAGEFKDGEMHGKGLLIYANGDHYKGDFAHGLRHGEGVLTRKFKDTIVIYTGTFVNDKGEGKAVQEVVGMFTIMSQCKDGMAFGPGVRYYDNGDTYQGHFKNNHHYNGTYTWANGDVYVGPFGGHTPQGEGVKTLSSGDRYTGDFHRGMYQGQGRYEFADGSVYEGDFVKNKMHGLGKIVFPDGSEYEGEFANDHMEGKGTFTERNGVKIYGIFKEDAYVGSE